MKIKVDDNRNPHARKGSIRRSQCVSLRVLRSKPRRRRVAVTSFLLKRFKTSTLADGAKVARMSKPDGREKRRKRPLALGETRVGVRRAYVETNGAEVADVRTTPRQTFPRRASLDGHPSGESPFVVRVRRSPTSPRTRAHAKVTAIPKSDRSRKHNEMLKIQQVVNLPKFFRRGQKIWTFPTF